MKAVSRAALRRRDMQDPHPPPFRTWLRRQAGRNDPVGTLAQDADVVDLYASRIAGVETPQTGGYREWRAQLRSWHAPHEAQEALKDAWGEYVQAYGR